MRIFLMKVSLACKKSKKVLIELRHITVYQSHFTRAHGWIADESQSFCLERESADRSGVYFQSSVGVMYLLAFLTFVASVLRGQGKTLSEGATEQRLLT